ncbi:MAG TPA: DNA repair protein RecN [Solirubrobacteraceae bacterium]
MLLELRVENLLLIERAQIALSPGLNVLTGETGAGKTVLAQALDLLLGGRARSGIVRPGANEAYVEGVFDLSAGISRRLAERLPDCVDLSDPSKESTMVLARRVGADGRTRAYLNGRSVAVGDLRELGPSLISFYGQHEHRKLTLSTAQLQTLDSFCGAEHLRRRDRCAEAHREVQTLEASLSELHGMGEVRERELGLLDHEISEIETVAPEKREHEELLVQRERLKRLDALSGAVSIAIGAVTGENSQTDGAIDLLALASSNLESVENVDPRLDELSARHRALLLEAEDLASETRRYRENLTGGHGDLDSVEDRLSQLDRLMRKHGESIEAVLAHAERSRRRREELKNAEIAFNEVTQRLEAARQRRATHIKALRAARVSAAPALAAAVRERLAGLAMPDVSFEIGLAERAPGPSGADTVEFLIATNPGVRAGALRDIASGGELSRVMLALMGVSSADSSKAGRQLTLVFDEVDSGIGGHTARTVGECLRELADGRQVLAITHLPQIASLAARHFTVVKDITVKPTRTTVIQLRETEVVSELVRMLGASEQDLAARTHAKELRRAA